MTPTRPCYNCTLSFIPSAAWLNRWPPVLLHLVLHSYYCTSLLHPPLLSYYSFNYSRPSECTGGKKRTTVQSSSYLDTRFVLSCIAKECVPSVDKPLCIICNLIKQSILNIQRMPQIAAFQVRHKVVSSTILNSGSFV